MIHLESSFQITQFWKLHIYRDRSSCCFLVNVNSKHKVAIGRSWELNLMDTNYRIRLNAFAYETHSNDIQIIKLIWDCALKNYGRNIWDGSCILANCIHLHSNYFRVNFDISAVIGSHLKVFFRNIFWCIQKKFKQMKGHAK